MSGNARSGRRKMTSLAMALSDWEVDEAWSLHKMGYTYRQIAERYGVSVSTIQRMFRRMRDGNKGSA
jgi:uncharacterized protein YerC